VAPPPSPTAANGDRDPASGRFVPGNKAAKGNPFARKLAERRQALLDAVTPKDIADVAKKLLDMALAGDLAAMHLLLKYAVGAPVEVVNPDTLDLAELDLLRMAPTVRELTALFRRVAPGLAAEKVLERHAADEEAYQRRVDQAVEEMRQEMYEIAERDLSGQAMEHYLQAFPEEEGDDNGHRDG
jgi:hypothetical protein